MRLNLSVKRKHISVLYKMMAYILLPIIILSVANIYINTYHVRFYENNVVENYTSSLSALSVNINDSLRQVLSTADLMSVDANITSILYDYSSASEPNVDVTYGAIETLRKFKSTLDFIDCISVVNRQSGYVVSDSGKTAADYYFNTGYRYEDYPETFWKNLSIPTAGYMLLPPVNVSTKAGKKVIPLISAGFNNIKSQNLIIINLSSEKFSEILLNNLWTKGNIFIVDESYKIFTSGHPASPAEAMFRQEGFLSGLHSETPFKYRYGDNEYVVVTYKDEATVFSKISFVAVASMRDLLYDFNRIRAIMNLLNAVLMIFAVFAAYKISKKLYSPILGLVNSLNGSDYFTKTDNMNEYDYLDRQIQKMLKTNSTMQRQLSATMPLACEQFIYKLLISAAPPTDADIDEFLSNNNMAFDLKFFTVISIKTVYSKKFYKSFTQSQYHAINIGIYNIFKFMFNDVYPSYIISPEGETLFLIINTHNENDDFDNIVAAFEDTVRAFQNDYELIDVSIGIGKPREGYEGIHRSYTEASEAQVMIAAYNEKKVMVYSEAHKVTNQYSYTIDDDNKLFNYMAKGSPEDTRALINDVLKRNLADGVGDAGIKLLYQKLYHTAVKALQT
ncbi:MAG: hypothetical protein LBH54_03210, partial [Clostridiales bacterium]|nr:hypothetical protein [Clostridiales bacterium]